MTLITATSSCSISSGGRSTVLSSQRPLWSMFSTSCCEEVIMSALSWRERSQACSNSGITWCVWVWVWWVHGWCVCVGGGSNWNWLHVYTLYSVEINQGGMNNSYTQQYMQIIKPKLHKHMHTFFRWLILSFCLESSLLCCFKMAVSCPISTRSFKFAPFFSERMTSSLPILSSSATAWACAVLTVARAAATWLDLISMAAWVTVNWWTNLCQNEALNYVRVVRRYHS